MDKAREFQKKTSTSAPLTMTKQQICPTNCGHSLGDGNARPPDLPPEKSVCRSRATVRTGHGTMDWFQIWKGVCQGCILSPCSMQSMCVCVCVLSHVQLFATPWTIACQASLSMEFSRQEYWSGLPFPSPSIQSTSCKMPGWM